MRVYDILAKKRDKLCLSFEELDYIVSGFVKDEIPDYQMSAFLMAVYINGLDQKELLDFTQAMIASGTCLDLSSVAGTKIDKHSTGGVGDKTTIILAPLVASVGVPVAKLSGRSLGHTGGTLDKLESIPGFTVDLSPGQFVKQLENIGVAVISASEGIVPADKKIYALRDVTATVSSIPLIASSIVSKKIAGGSDGIVFDVKCGSGAFIKTIDQARELANQLVSMVKSMGKKSTAVISDMNQPLGFAVGNSLEVAEAIDTLKGEGPQDLEELCLILGAHMLLLAQRASNLEEGKTLLKKAISTGAALAKLEEFIVAQGGNTNCIESTKVLPRAQFIRECKTDKSGYVLRMDTEKIGYTAVQLGAGRLTKEGQIDHATGLIVAPKIGGRIEKGDVIVEIHSNTNQGLDELEEQVKGAFVIGSSAPKPKALIYDYIGMMPKTE